ncbi:MAG TPA: DUF4142 domain-containing protein [Ensifer sp.]|nr:DUF4142 domain-containing protein [Ensifer sp.]
MKTATLATIMMIALPFQALGQQPPPATELPQNATPAKPPEGQPPGADVFVDQIASFNLFDLELARLAQKRSNDPKMRALADKAMEVDQKAQDELQAAANEQRVRFQPNLTAEQAEKLNALKAAPNDQLDTVFLSARMAAAQSQMSLLALYGSKGEAGALKRYALSAFQQARTNFLEAHEMSGKWQGDGACAAGCEVYNELNSDG